MTHTTTDRRSERPTTDQENRETRISRDADGTALGLAIFINADEMRALGVDPEDATHVTYSITEDGLDVGPADVQDSGE